MKKLIFAIMFSNIMISYSQTDKTEKQITNYRAEFIEVLNLLDNNSLDEAKTMLQNLENDLSLFKAFRDNSVESIENQLNEIINQLKSEKASLQNKVNDLESELQIARTKQTDEIMKVVESILNKKHKQEKKVIELENKLNSLSEKYDKEWTT